MKFLNTAPKAIVAIAVVGALGYAYAQTSTNMPADITQPNTRATTEVDQNGRPITGRSAVDINNSSNTSPPNAITTEANPSMRAETNRDTSTNYGARAMDGERVARADRN